MRHRSASLLLVALLSTPTLAGTPAMTAAPTLAEKAARRFPQPVRVGDLIGRQVLQPTPAQHVLGRVVSIDRNANGGIDVVMRFGGVLGFGARPIAVPVEAVALLGEHLAILDFTPEALRDFPTNTATSDSAIPPGESIRVGLTKPFH